MIVDDNIQFFRKLGKNAVKLNRTKKTAGAKLNSSPFAKN